MLVKVVVVLGTEPVLAVRSDGPSCASREGAWARIAGTELSDRMGWALWAKLLFPPNSVEKTPKGIDCLVVVAGVNVGGSALESAMSEPLRFGGGAENCGEVGV